MLQSEAALEQSRAQQTNLKQQRARPSKEKKYIPTKKSTKTKRDRAIQKKQIKKTARGLTTVEIIRANSDPYTSSKLRRQKS